MRTPPRILFVGNFLIRHWGRGRTGIDMRLMAGATRLNWPSLSFAERDIARFVTADEPQRNKRFILELPLHADVVFVHAWKADTFGNVMYRRTSRNFNEAFATAADHVIVEAEQIVEVGELDPDQIMTPGFIVDAVVQGKVLTEA